MTRSSSRWLWVLWLAALLFIHRYLFDGTIEAGRDIFRLFIPEAAYLRDRLLQGQVPLWNPLVRLGQPFAATLTSEAFYPPHVLLVLLFGPTWGIQASIVFHAALGSAGAWFASRRLGGGRIPAAVAGAFAFTPLFTRLAGSLHMASAMAWSGFIVAAALHLARRPSVRAAAWLAIPLALSFFCGAPEVVLWQGALALGLACSGRAAVRALPFLALAVAWGFLLCAVAALPALELWKASVSPGALLEDASFWSTSPAQLLSMFWPWADHPRSLAADGPDQWLATSLFVGSICGLLALLCVRKNKKLAVLVAVAIGCAVLCLGRHFLPARLLLSLPPLSGFRHPVKYAFGLAFCISLLSAQGLRRLTVWARPHRSRVRALALVLVATAVLLPLLQFLAGLAPWREGMKSGALWFGVWVAAVGVCFAVLGGGAPGSRRVGAAVLALVAAELAFANQLIGHVALVPAHRLSEPGRLAAAIRAEPHGRMSINVEDGESLPQLQLDERDYLRREFIGDSRENLVGLRPLEESLAMVEGYGFRDPWRQTDALEAEPRGPYDVFGVTHFVRHGPAPFSDLEPMNETGWSRAYRSRTAFPRAWVVTRARVVSDAQALDQLRNHSALLRTEVALAEGQRLDGPWCESSVALEERSPERLRLSVDACARGYLVVADSHYPGWVAFVNDVPTPILRADSLLRAVRIDPGPAIVRMEYRPASVQWGGWMSALGWAAVVAVLRRLKTLPRPLQSFRVDPSTR